MDVRDRSTYTPSLESGTVEAASRTSAGGRAATSPDVPIARQDSSVLSSASHAVAQTLQLPEVRQERVAQLQQQIAEGSYRAAPQDVADAMLHEFGR